MLSQRLVSGAHSMPPARLVLHFPTIPHIYVSRHLVTPFLRVLARLNHTSQSVLGGIVAFLPLVIQSDELRYRPRKHRGVLPEMKNNVLIIPLSLRAVKLTSTFASSLGRK